MERKNIIQFVAPLVPRGAETYAINLANELSKHHNVTVIDILPDNGTNILREKIAPTVNLTRLHEPSRAAKKASQYADGVLVRLGKARYLQRQLMDARLLNTIKILNADVIHSHLVGNDYLVADALQSLRPDKRPVLVTTDHGDWQAHETALNETGEGLWPNYRHKRDVALGGLNHAVYVSDHQRPFWNAQIEKGYDINLSKIYYGTPGIFKEDIVPAEIGLRDETFRYCMVAAGNEASKGWQLAVDAFIEYDHPDTQLVLVGGGTEIDRLHGLHGNNPNIVFTGLVGNPLDYIRLCDVGLLPSTYDHESLPNAVMEYQQCDLPSIVADVGECANMLDVPGSTQKAGAVLQVRDKQVVGGQLKNQMQRMHENRQDYCHLQELASLSKMKFNMANCAANNVDIYNEELARRDLLKRRYV